MLISIYWTIGITIAAVVIGYLLSKAQIAKLNTKLADLNNKYWEEVHYKMAEVRRASKANNELEELQLSYRAATELQERTQANLDHQNMLYRRELKLAEKRKFSITYNNGPDKVDGTDDWYYSTIQTTPMLFTEEQVKVAEDRAKKYPNLVKHK